MLENVPAFADVRGFVVVDHGSTWNGERNVCLTNSLRDGILLASTKPPPPASSMMNVIRHLRRPGEATFMTPITDDGEDKGRPMLRPPVAELCRSHGVNLHLYAAFQGSKAEISYQGSCVLDPAFRDVRMLWSANHWRTLHNPSDLEKRDLEFALELAYEDARARADADREMAEAVARSMEEEDLSLALAKKLALEEDERLAHELAAE